MKMKKLMMFMVAAALGLMLAAPAFAAPITEYLLFNSGTIASPDWVVLAESSGPGIDFVQSYDGWNIQFNVSGTQYAAQPPDIDLGVTASRSTATNLDLAFMDTAIGPYSGNLISDPTGSTPTTGLSFYAYENPAITSISGALPGATFTGSLGTLLGGSPQTALAPPESVIGPATDMTGITLESQFNDATKISSDWEVDDAPEPSTFLLLGLGLLGAAFLIKRKKRLPKRVLR